MKTKRLLFLVMAICLARGVKAQFYDGPDDIYYYVEEYYEYEETYGPGPRFGQKTGKTIKKIPNGEEAYVLIFNFDGKKAANLGWAKVSSIKSELSQSSSYFEDKVETTDYNWKYSSSSYAGTIYESPNNWGNCTFSSDRSTLTRSWYQAVGFESCKCTQRFKRVDKSFFKVGRSRTPSGTLHE